MLDKDGLRAEIFDSLQQRIQTEKTLLRGRLTRKWPEKKRRDASQSRKSRRSHKTGRLYEVFQSFAYEEDDA